MEVDFRKRIIELMESKDINQSELSRRTGITQSSLSDYIKGKYKPKQDKIDLIAKALETAPSYLMGWDDDAKTHEAFEYLLERQLYILGYEIKAIESEGYLWIKHNGANYEITENDMKLLTIASKNNLKNEVEKIIAKSIAENSKYNINTIAAHAIGDLNEEDQLKILEFARKIKSQRNSIKE